MVIFENKDLFDDIGEYDVILIGTNIYCNLSQGLQRKVMLNYPFVQDKNMSTKYGDEKKLGTILECKKENSPIFVLMYINRGNFRPDISKEYLDYEALENSLKLVNILYKNKKIASTVLGNSRFEGYGNKDKILKMMSDFLPDVDLTVYDYEQLSRSEELKKTRERELKIKETDIDAYYEAVKQRKMEADERFKNNGHARY